MLYGHDEGKNIKQLCDGTKDVVCIKMGGTGASSLAEAQEKLGIKENSDRIDNIVGSSGMSNTEIVDARLSSDGTRHHTLKSRLDAENSELKSDLSDKLPFNSSHGIQVVIEKQETFPNDEQSIRYAGVDIGGLYAHPGYATSDFVPLDNLVGIYRYGTTTNFAMFPYAFYDADKKYIDDSYVGNTTDYIFEDYNGKTVTWIDLKKSEHPNAKYIRYEWQKSRPYTYIVVTTETHVECYDVPKIKVEGIDPLPLYGKKIVNFGDSIFGNFRDTNETTDKSISKMIEEKTGAKVYNCGFGGCRMATHSNYWDAFSMHSIADSVASGDWTVQDNAIVSGSESLPSYFTETVALLKTIDFSNVDYITIGYGTNDYAGNVFVHGTEASFTEEWDYFKGALKYSIKTILNKYPHIKIVVISPCWRWFLEEGAYSYSSDDDTSKNTRNYKLTDYVDVCESVCKEYHIPYIDTYYTLGFNEFTHLEYFPQSDGTHPNQKGRQLRADRITGQLLSLFN